MGDTKKTGKSYSTPSHPWLKTRIDDENKLISGYGLKTKKEIWKAEKSLEKFRSLARELVGEVSGEEAKKKEELIEKLNDLGILNKDADLEDVLSLKVENFLDRALQTLVYKKGIANSPKQARQLILHGHIELKGRIHTAPRTLIPVDEEETIAYVGPAPKKPKEPAEKAKEEKKGQEKKSEEKPEKKEESKEEDSENEKKKPEKKDEKSKDSEEKKSEKGEKSE
ncbi:MAG: 30S ribosomal protein S4 [Candidatus Undinarchaeales archaeon]